MAKHKYLAQGEQTQLTSLVYDHAERARKIVIINPQISSLPEPLINIFRTCRYIHTSLDKIEGYTPQPRTETKKEIKKRERNNDALKKSIFRQRDLHQILEEGYFPTCSDIGLLFRGLMIAQDIPTAYVETFHEDYLLDKAFHTHTWARVFNGDMSVLVNPNLNPKIEEDEVRILPYVILTEGLDCWDIRISSYEDLRKQKRLHKDELLTRLEENRAIEFRRRMSAIETARHRL